MDNPELPRTLQEETAALRRRSTWLTLLMESAEHLLSTDDPQEQLEGVFAQVAEHLGADVYFNFVINAAGDTLNLEFCGGIDQPVQSFPVGQAICGIVAATRQPIVRSELESSHDDQAARLRELGVRAYCCHPLIVGGRLLGTLSYGSRTRPRFEDDEVDLLRQLCHFVAMAKERTLLQEEARERETADAAARERETFLGRILESSHDCIKVLEQDSRLVSMSPAGQRLLDIQDIAPLLDTPWLDLWEGEDRHRAAAAVAEAREGRMARFVGQGATMTGRMRWWDVLVSPLPGATDRLLCISRDITERRQAEDALRDEARVTETLNRVGTLLAAELDLNRLMQVLIDEATALCGARFGSFFYNAVDEEGGDRVLYTLSGAPREAFSRFPVPGDTPLFALTFHGKGVVRSDDITHDARYGKSAPYHGMPSGHLPVRSYLAVPVISRSGAVLGGLFFGHGDAGVFTERHEQLLAGVASQAAIAIDNARLYQSAQRAEETARSARDQLRAITDAVPALISLVDRDGVYRLTNHAYADWFPELRTHPNARSVREVLGDAVWEQIHPHLDRALAGEKVHYEAQLAYRGGPRWVHVTYTPQRGAGGDVNGVVALVTDVTEARARERTLNFLVSLNDALRTSDDPREVMQVVTRALGEHMGVSRCAYATVEDDGGHFLVEGDYNQGVASVIGRYPLAAFGERAFGQLTAGQTYVVNDIEAEPGLDLSAYRATSIRAVIAASLIKAGKPVALMAVQHSTPRIWTRDEIDLVEMVAERSWAYIERVSAAQRLQALNERLSRAMRETHHRVKNNLQVVAAMVDMQTLEHEASRSVPLDELQRLAAHVRTLALVHDHLTRNLGEEEEQQRISAGAVLAKLLPLLAQTTGGRLLESRVDDVLLTGKQCTALALVASELVSNAVKHADDGEIDLSFSIQGARGELTVCDNGPGFADDFDPVLAANTGLQLVEGVAATDLTGSVAYQNRPGGGARVVVSFPLPDPPT